jgi:hypothetical protein
MNVGRPCHDRSGPRGLWTQSRLGVERRFCDALPMRFPLSLMLFVVLTCACGKPFSSDTLGIRYEPPDNARIVGTEAHGRKVTFAGGIQLELVEIARSEPSLPARALLHVVQQAGASELEGELDSATNGTLAIGPVARVQLRSGNQRSLVYIAQHPRGYLVLKLTASAEDFGRKSNAFERSLGSLKRL